jgi:NTP pyrophosphatase (non-canonical NTP hydrolase)
MDLKELETKITEIFEHRAKKDGITLTDDYLLIKLTEELGEFMQAYLIYQKRCRPEKYLAEPDAKKDLAKELSDVVCLCLIIAHKLNIYLEEAITKKWITREWLKS